MTGRQSPGVQPSYAHRRRTRCRRRGVHRGWLRRGARRRRLGGGEFRPAAGARLSRRRHGRLPGPRQHPADPELHRPGGPVQHGVHVRQRPRDPRPPRGAYRATAGPEPWRSATRCSTPRPTTRRTTTAGCARPTTSGRTSSSTASPQPDGFVRADGTANVGTQFGFTGTAVGDMAWAGIALSALARRTGARRFLAGAVRIGDVDRADRPYRRAPRRLQVRGQRGEREAAVHLDRAQHRPGLPLRTARPAHRGPGVAGAARAGRGLRRRRCGSRPAASSTPAPTTA